MSDRLDTAALGDAWGQLEQQVEQQRPDPSGASFLASSRRELRYYRPLSNAVDGFVREATDSKRIYLGIDEFDREMRGIGAGHLALMVGFAHSGKTLVLLHALRNNRDKRVALFIPDEPATLVLAKLASMTSGIPARTIESLVAQRDNDTINLLKQVASDEFPNLAVFDKPLTPHDMEQAWSEVSDVWGAEPELAVVDYVDLVQAGDATTTRFEFLKGFGSRHNVPLIALHQTSRSAGAEGRKMTISSGNFGGETYATFMMGVRRKKYGLLAELAEQQEKHQRTGSEAAADRVEELRYQLGIHEYTLTANLVKNKRPGGSTVDDIDFELDVETGRIYPLRDGELPDQYLTAKRGVEPTPTPPPAAVTPQGGLPPTEGMF